MVGQSQSDVGQESAREHVDLFLGSQFNGVAQSLFGSTCIVTRNHFDRPAQQAASLVDFFYRQLPALAIGLGKLRDGGIAVDLADANGRLGRLRTEG